MKRLAKRDWEVISSALARLAAGDLDEEEDGLTYEELVAAQAKVWERLR